MSFTDLIIIKCGFKPNTQIVGGINTIGRRSQTEQKQVVNVPGMTQEIQAEIPGFRYKPGIYIRTLKPFYTKLNTFAIFYFKKHC